MSAFDSQVNGDHYKNRVIQPAQLAYAVFKGDAFSYNIAKYLTRKKEAWDIQAGKAFHCWEMLREVGAASPITPELTYTERLILDTFIRQEPEQLHPHFKVIFDIMLCPSYTKRKEHIKSIREAMNAIADYHMLQEALND